MGRLVQVSESTALQVQLPNGGSYTYPNYVVLSNEEYAVVNTASAALTDKGAFPLVNRTPQGPVVPSLGALDLLNSDTVQVGNPTAPARTNLSRRVALTDVALAIPATSQVVFVPIFCADGDVITNVVYKVGATAAGTPTHQFVALYSPAGALIHQSADGTSTARAANATVTTALSAAYTVPAAGGGVFYAAIGFTATTTPSLLCQVLAADTGVEAPFSNLSSSAKVLLARKTVGGAYTTTAPATIAGATGLTTTVNAPYVILT